MTTLQPVRVMPERTTDRVTIAWSAAHPVTQRALVAACVTAVALGLLSPLPVPAGAGTAICGALLAAAALVDVYELKLPNRLLLAALTVTVAGLVGTGQVVLLGRGVLGMLLAGGLMLLVRLTRGVGMGDVKMAAVVGAGSAPVALVAAPLAIAIAALSAAGYGALAHRRRLALGPALWFGWAAALAGGTAGWLS